MYRKSVELTVRDTVRNSPGVLCISLLFSAALVPFATTVFLSRGLAWLAGLWTSSLLCGVIVVSGFRLTTEIAARHESIPTTPLWRGIREEWSIGVSVGAITFIVLVLLLVLINVPLSGLLGQMVGVMGAYLILGWSLLLGFALPVYARVERSNDGPFPVGEFRFALATGVGTVVQNPLAMLWLLVQTTGWTFIAVVTLVTPVLLLPGFLILLAAEISELTVPWGDLDDIAPVPMVGYDWDTNHE